MHIDYNKKYKQILSPIRYHKNGKPFTRDSVELKCNYCDNTVKFFLLIALRKLKSDYDFKCKSCHFKSSNTFLRVKEINKNKKGKTYEEIYGYEKAKFLRENKKNNLEIIKRLNNFSNFQKGKTYDKIYGEKKSSIIKNKISKFSKTQDISKFRKMGQEANKNRKYKSWEDQFGKELSDKKKKELSKKNKGKNNPMYGKISPKGSGKGVSGWYNDWFFRSLLELSFMINYIEKNNICWKSAENNNYKIKYIDYKNSERTYIPDFILNGNLLVEIKPKRLVKTPLIKLKTKAAKLFCKKNNMKYKIFTENDFEKLDQYNLKKLLENNKIKLLNLKNKQYILESI
jgi:hypothetical protein